MSEVMLVKQASLDGFSEAELAAVRRFLFQVVDGHGKQGRSVWRRLWARITRAEVGELFRLGVKQDRSGPYHRRTMAILQAVFDAQERFTDFDQFVNWIKIGAAWVDWVPGAKGGIVPLPKSISYREADQDAFMEFTAGAIAFLRGEHAAPYLWKHLNPTQAGLMVHEILAEFDA